MSQLNERRRDKIILVVGNLSLIGWELLYYLQGSNSLRFVLVTGFISFISFNLLVWLLIRWRRARGSNSRTDSAS